MLVWEALKKSQRLSEQKSGTDIGFSHIYFQKIWEQPEQFSWLEIICYLVLLPDMRLKIRWCYLANCNRQRIASC